MEFSRVLLVTLLLLLVVISSCSAENEVDSAPSTTMDVATRQETCYAVPPRGMTKHIIIPSGLAAPLGWTTVGFDDSSWDSTSTFPFGDNIICPEYGPDLPLGGDWPLNTRILTRNKFWLSSVPNALTIKLTVDNRARLWISSPGNTPWMHDTGLLEGCPEVTDPYYESVLVGFGPGQIPLQLGWNVIAIEGRDIGVQSWLNFEASYICKKIAFSEPPVSCIVIGEGTPTRARTGGGGGLFGTSWTVLPYPPAASPPWFDSTFSFGQNLMCTELLGYTLNGPFPLNGWLRTRSVFSVTTEPLNAKLQVTVDDQAWVYLNGNLILNTGDLNTCLEWGFVHELDITCQLQHGLNIIAVRAKDRKKCQSFLHVRLVIAQSPPCSLSG